MSRRCAASTEAVEKFDQQGLQPTDFFAVDRRSFQQQILGAGRNRLFEFFAHGYPGQARKIAGMKRPRIWSTG